MSSTNTKHYMKERDVKFTFTSSFGISLLFRCYFMPILKETSVTHRLMDGVRAFHILVAEQLILCVFLRNLLR